jgi:phosphate:Na+ symporter
MIQKNVTFSQRATAEYKNISSSVIEILESSYQSFSENDYEAAYKTEFFEQNIAAMKEELRTSHILRVQKGECSVDVGFVWSDLLTNLVRVSNHCSNISGSVIDRMKSRFSVHNTNNA